MVGWVLPTHTATWVGARIPSSLCPNLNLSLLRCQEMGPHARAPPLPSPSSQSLLNLIDCSFLLRCHNLTPGIFAFWELSEFYAKTWCSDGRPRLSCRGRDVPICGHLGIEHSRASSVVPGRWICLPKMMPVLWFWPSKLTEFLKSESLHILLAIKCPGFFFLSLSFLFLNGIEF